MAESRSGSIGGPKEQPKEPVPSTSGPANQRLPAADKFHAIGLIELFETDERPVIVYDLYSQTKTVPIYCNPRVGTLQIEGLKLITGTAARQEQDDLRHHRQTQFAAWALSGPADTTPASAIISGFEWKCQTLRARWRVISGNAAPAQAQAPVKGTLERDGVPRSGRHTTVIPLKSSSNPKSGAPVDTLEAQLEAFRLYRGGSVNVFPVAQGMENNYETTKNLSNGFELGPFDLTVPEPAMDLSAHIQFFLAFDWESTDLGPINSWSIELRRMANFMLYDPRSAAMYWGPNRIMLYNEAYVMVTGQKHPGMMGKPFVEAWEEILDDFKPAFDKAYEMGIATTMNEALFYINRDGYLEETYYSISMIPFGTTEGVAFYNPVIDITRQVISDRRMLFLLRVGQFIASSREPKDFWHQLLKGLEPNHLDIPFAILYSAGDERDETLSVSSEQSAGLTNWVLEGSVRVQESESIPKRLSSAKDLENFLPNFLEYIKSDYPTQLRTSDNTLPASLVRNLGTQLEDDVCEIAIFLPIRSTSDKILGFLIIGVNPRKRYDDDYRLFIELLSRQLATSLATAVLFEDETRRALLAAEQATTDRNLLSRKLAIQAHEVSAIESRFRRMADMAPVGMFHISPAGYLIYANEQWYDLTQHERNITYPMSWVTIVMEEDKSTLINNWAELTKGETIPSFEIRLKRPYTPEEIVSGEKVEGDTWIIAACYPEKAEDGSVLPVGILGCFTDISRQKWAEGFQMRKKSEAIETKRQQENFIDMTSHEMRNPLSAILQSADFIGNSVVEFMDGSNDVVIPREVSEGYADAAQTIILCAQHQQRIIDDVLMLSKLDSDLLLITPVETQPLSVLENALRMFDVELRKHDIELRFRVDSSHEELAINWVKIDPSRMLQVLINLITNAIKFTQPEARRQIMVTLGAALEKPTNKDDVDYLPRSDNRKDMSLGPGWGAGDAVYIKIHVKDSGRGLTDPERVLLFQRFSQASPRTHVQYGGSGLGLFISRELTELQGGQIGVASQPGVGSTFAFYIKARRCEAPAMIPEATQHMLNLKHPSKIIRDGPSSLNNLSPLSRSPEPGHHQLVLGAKHVLVVEDNLVNQKVLSKQLRMAGCIVSVANHGQEALDFLATTRFWAGRELNGAELSLILMDLEMPVMDGLTCVKRIRRLQTEGLVVRHVPVIAVTANARSAQIAVAKEAGMDSVVTKPFRISELIPEMDRQLRLGMLKRLPSSRLLDVERSASAPV